jgi:hypothetical protein
MALANINGRCLFLFIYGIILVVCLGDLDLRIATKLSQEFFIRTCAFFLSELGSIYEEKDEPDHDLAIRYRFRSIFT